MKDTPPAMEALERCPDLWFSDCGLIMRAGSTLFRLSSEMLAARSPVFASMLSFPQPADAETYDGCPVLHLQDCPMNLRVFLRALFDYDFFKPHPVRTDFAVIYGVLKLSHKYQVDGLRQRALVHFSSRFRRILNPTTSSWSYRPTDLPSVITLSREVGALWLLPTAYYKYIRAFEPNEIIMGHFIHGTRTTIPPVDQAAVLTGVLVLRTQKVSEFLDFLWDPDLVRGCASVTACFLTRIAKRRHVDERDRARGFSEILSPADIEGMDVCGRCKAGLKAGYKAAMAKLEASLPGIFNLPEWDVLESMMSKELM
ncbi:hypothetical protein DFH09DRAFT_260787 [Mycena vulgaris]|nr:hypothetical protein DFH09DRAFT_260787 [Mycena vulgaris]